MFTHTRGVLPVLCFIAVLLGACSNGDAYSDGAAPAADASNSTPTGSSSVAMTGDAMTASEPSEPSEPHDPNIASVSVGPDGVVLHQPLVSPKGYTASLDMELPSPVVVLGDPGKVTVDWPSGVGSIANTTDGGRPAQVSTPDWGIVNLWYRIPAGLLDGPIETSCLDSTEQSKKHPWLLLKMTYLTEDPSAAVDLPAELRMAALPAVLTDSNGTYCMASPKAEFPEQRSAAVQALIAGGPDYVEVPLGAVGFADGVSNALCHVARNFNTSQGMSMFQGGEPMSFKEAHAAPVGLCSDPEARKGTG